MKNWQNDLQRFHTIFILFTFKHVYKNIWLDAISVLSNDQENNSILKKWNVLHDS